MMEEVQATAIRRRIVHSILGGSIEDVPFERQTLPGLQYFVGFASWDEAQSKPLETWSCSPNLRVWFGEGSGQVSTPFRIRSQEFISICTEFEFSEEFLNKFVAKAPLFEYRFIFPKADVSPSYLEIAMATYENDGFFCLLRYDLNARSAKVVLFSKTMDHVRKTPFLNSVLIMWFKQNEAILQRNPLLVLNVLIEYVQFRAYQYVQWRVELYNLEARLAVTLHGQTLKRRGYGDVDHDFTLLNSDLAGIAGKLADTELSASVLLDHAKGFQRLVDMCEEYEARGRQQSRPLFSEQQEEVHATIVRAEMFLKSTKMAQDVLYSFSAVLYNRINKQDTNSMKTIAVVTLVFLPATFISTVFSTGIFNFHASESPGNPRTVSKYGWIYLISCVLSTTLTLFSWVCWYWWGRVWLEKLQFSRIHSNGKRRQSTSI
jgi:hypothetical protein